MEHIDSGSELVVATPERVSFEYRLAGPGSRFVAQSLDLLIVGAVMVVLGFGSIALAVGTGDGNLAVLVFVLATFVLLFGYFWFFEALWTGQTVGKRVMKLRVVGDRGEPLTFVHASVRNLIRIIDFLPFGYGIGLAVLFANGRGKRLGDLAAGTVVVREGAAISLDQLARQAEAASGTPQPPGDEALRHLEPELRRFVVAYAARRPWLPIPHRDYLAHLSLPAIQKAAPDMVAFYGPLAGLDHLANQVVNPGQIGAPPRG